VKTNDEINNVKELITSGSGIQVLSAKLDTKVVGLEQKVS